MALTITQAMADSFKSEVLQGIHKFLASGGATFKMLLLNSTAAGTGTYNQLNTNVGTPGSGTPTTSNVGTDETTDTSGNNEYTSGGFTMTPNSNPTLDLTNNVAYINWATNPSWGPAASIASRGAILWNVTAGGNIVGVFDFGSDKTCTTGTFTVTLPAAAYNTAIVRFA
jgi:hypothetical protein